MKKLIYFLLISGVLVLGVGLALVAHYKLWERLVIFATIPVFGKSWTCEVEKQNGIYHQTKAEMIFLGDSHMEQCEWNEVFPNWKTANRGIGGEGTEGLLARIAVLSVDQDQTVFLQIGINDLLNDRTPEQVKESYVKILSLLEQRKIRVVPSLIFYVRYIPHVNPMVTKLNQSLLTLFRDRKIEFIDLNPQISENETLLKKYSIDGIHLNNEGYKIWIHEIEKRIRIISSASDSL